MADGEMATVNDLVESIDYQWDLLLRTDDDIFYSKGWYEDMIKVLSIPDIKLVNGTHYPTQRVIAQEVLYWETEIAPGTSWLCPRETWDTYGPLQEGPQGQQEDVWFSEKIRASGYKVAVLADPYKVVHCGIHNSLGRGRGEVVEEYMLDKITQVGAYYE
jgi:hypothetical protein